MQLFAVGLAGSLHAQTLTAIGPDAPSPRTNDIFQLFTSGNQTWPDGLNYFTDNNPPVGQTFTTGTNARNLDSVAIKTAGLNAGNGYGTPANTPTYDLRIYSMSNNTATLLITFSAPNPGFTDGDWLQWSGLNAPLAMARTPTLPAKSRSFPSRRSASTTSNSARCCRENGANDLVVVHSARGLHRFNVACG